MSRGPRVLASRVPGLVASAAELALLAPGRRAASYLASLGTRLGDAREGEGFGASLGLAVGVAADEAFRALMMALSDVPHDRELARCVSEIAEAAVLFDERGWFHDPHRYHLAPDSPAEPIIRKARSLGREYEHLQFRSGYEPHHGEPGRDRWLSQASLGDAHAWMLRHHGEPRPWLICLHGYRMGFPAADFHAFRARWLHQEGGFNVLIPTLPLHGRRKIGRRSGDGFFSAATLDTVHAVAQAVWDVRRLIAWIRRDSDAPVGVYGVSLGGYVTAVLSAFDADLGCAIAMMPTSCLASLLRQHTPRRLAEAATRNGLSWTEMERVLQVISPLALQPAVAPSRRFLIGAASDRLVPEAHLQALWKHWNEPAIEWLAGTHLSFSWQTSAVNSIVSRALSATGFVTTLEPSREEAA